MMDKKHAPNDPLPNATKLASYQIVRMIARGGSSFVYLAEDKQKKLVAIKEYIPHKLSLRDQAQLNVSIPIQHQREFRQSLKTFFSEYRTLSRVTHPGIIRVVDFFSAHNTFYLVTNYQPGSSLSDFIRHRLYKRMGYRKDSLLHVYLRYRRYKNRIIGSRQVIGERSIKKILSLVIDAISKLHEHEFLYLDLKPANIYLSYHGSPILLDLGAARCTLQENRKRLNWVYTKGYAAPELLLKRRAWMGPWTDAYSIGATLFACMCGYSPQSADQREMNDRLPKAFKALRKLYSSDLLDLVEWCLLLDREQRPQSMAVLQERLLACQLNHAPRPRRRIVKRFFNWARRKTKTGASIAECT